MPRVKKAVVVKASSPKAEVAMAKKPSRGETFSAVGRRKRARALVRLAQGDSQILINNLKIGRAHV